MVQNILARNFLIEEPMTTLLTKNFPHILSFAWKPRYVYEAISQIRFENYWWLEYIFFIIIMGKSSLAKTEVSNCSTKCVCKIYGPLNRAVLEL